MLHSMRLAPLVAMAVLALLAATTSAIDGEEEVYTVIDAEYHHLGDHYVTTYQPQSPEGTEYETTFEAPEDVENPAIKMWIRGQVPPESASIDFVKLFVNGHLIAFLNEYAMGSGSIYEVDDEVEIEVSLEEWVLNEGTNEFKIVTGWGTSETDRDDIMFWNIRLVRAKPLEASVDLLSPTPGDVHFTGLDTERVSLIVWNDRHVDALQWVLVTLDPGGADTAYRWVQNTDRVSQEGDATDHANFPTHWWETRKDILNRTWVINVTLSFKWNFPTDGPVDIRVLVRDDQTRLHTFLFEDVLEVRTDLQLSRPVTLLGDVQGVLGPGSWVKGGENLSLEVPPVVYKGGGEVHPPDGVVWVQLVFDDDMVGYSEQGSGETWTVEWSAPVVARRTVTLAVNFLGLPSGAGGLEPVVFDLEVDGAGPAWASMSPSEGEWVTTSSLTAWADVDDGPGSGVDGFRVEFQLWDVGSSTWEPWSPVGLDTNGGVDGSVRTMTVLDLDEAWGHSVRWRAWDLVGNGPTVSDAVRFGVDVQSVVLEPVPVEGWIRTENVTLVCLVSDPDDGMGSSGVDPGSVEYSALLVGAEGWTDWTAPVSSELLDDGSSLHATVTVTLVEGSGNFVRWRARDMAGNPLVVTPPQMLMIDTRGPQMMSHWPSGRTLASSEGARAVVTFSDMGGSGVDLDRMESALWTGTLEDLGGWTPFNATGDPDDLVRVEVPVDGLEGHDNWVMWRAWDLAGNGPVETGPFRLMFNLPPTATVASPLEGSSHEMGIVVLLSAEGSSDPDDDDRLSYEWWSDRDGLLGSGPQVRTTLSPGQHTITLRVDDGLGGDHVDEDSVDVAVLEPVSVKEPISPWLILLLILIAVSTIASLREWRARRRRRFQGLL